MGLWGLVPAQSIALSCAHDPSCLPLYLQLLKPCSCSLLFLLSFLPAPLLSFLLPFPSFFSLLRRCCSPRASSLTTTPPQQTQTHPVVSSLYCHSTENSYILCTGLIPRMSNPLAMMVAVASHSSSLHMFTFTIWPAKHQHRSWSSCSEQLTPPSPGEPHPPTTWPWG